MSFDNRGEQASASKSSADKLFCAGLVRALSKTEGVIKQIFKETHHAFVLRFLHNIGEDDALSYLRKKKERIAAYISSKNPPQRFRKYMNEEDMCVYVLVSWFISNLVKSGTVSNTELYSKDFSFTFDESTLVSNLKCVEEFLSQDDLLRTYISLGLLISFEQKCFSEQELRDYLGQYPQLSKQVLAAHYDDFKTRVMGGTEGFRLKIASIESDFETLALKYESAAETLKQLKIPEEALAEETGNLASSIEHLRKSFSEKWLKEEGYELGENESVETLQGMRNILENIEKRQAEKRDTAFEKARGVLEKAGRLNIRGEESSNQLLADFRAKVDFLSNQIGGDRSLCNSLLGAHVVAKILKIVEAGEKPAGTEIGTLLLDLQEFCGSNATNSLIANLMLGKIVLANREENRDQPEVKKKEEAAKSLESEAKKEEAATEKTIEGQNRKQEEPSKKSPDPHQKQEKVEESKPEAEKSEAVKKVDPAASSIEKLVPSYEYARNVKTSLKYPELENLLWALIYEDDLSGAYWLSRALEGKYGQSPVQPWTIMAIQGSRWLTTDSLAHVESLLEIAKSHKPEHSHTDFIMGLAASIRPALIQPGCGLIDWLQKPEKYSPALIKLVDAVREFSKYGRAILPEDVQDLSGSLDLSTKIQDAATAATRWLREASAKKAKFRMATEVWRELTSPRGEIYEFLQPISANDTDKVQDVGEKLQRWQKLDYVEQKIDDITAKISKLRTQKIVGSPRQQIIRHIEEGCELAYSWYQYVNRAQEHGKRGNKLSEQIRILQKSIRECAPGLCESLAELVRSSEPACVAASFACLARSIKQVSADLNLGFAAELDKLKLPPDNQWDWLKQDSRNLREALGRRLVAMPDYLSVYGIDLKEEQQDVFLRAFCDSIAANESFSELLNIWIGSEDYRLIEVLKLALNEDQKNELQRVYDKALTDSGYRLKEALAMTSGIIEQALVDGVITEELHSENNDELQAIEASEDLNFKEKHRRLHEIGEKIDARRGNRLNELKKDWEQIHKMLESSSTSTAIKDHVRAFIDDALDRKDTRVIEESLAYLKEAFDRGTDLDEGLFKAQRRADELTEFIAAVPKIKNWLESGKGLNEVATTIDQGLTGAEIVYGQLQRPRRDESVKAIAAWRNLKKQSPNAKNLEDDISALMRFVGFNLEFKNSIPPIQISKKGQDWAYCTANMSAGDLARPIPQFGSLTRNRYEVICLWERPGADTIAARLKELKLTFGSVIVLFLGRLHNRQRQDLVRISRDRTVSAVLLDEILLVHLTKERDASNRLPVFLRCALPYTVLNPYTPFQAGDVPPEMFFGREDMIRELQKMGGSCIVFGGRQLGKSALLRRVQREFHNPERDQFAAVVDIKLLGDPKAMKETSQIWGRIRESLKSMELLGKTITTDRAEEIRRYVRDVMQSNNRRKLILLFDEADNFLEADAKENFREVEAMRQLMLESEYRFKIVFAGLQNVLRFQGIPNQPLAHFGTPIRVGPLEAEAAQRLVSEPFEALGYRLEDDRTTVLRILSYTNYHPGLIQLFCQELLRRLERLTGNMSPPFPLRQEDVEAVYRLDEVRNRIKERFDWTLALNSQYQAIAWVLVLDQIEKRDSYARAYSPGNILNLAREYWKEGFGEVGLDELRGLLDEMCGLGVLVRNQDGHYRLRSPNLVRLLGTDDDILNNLSELAHKKAPLSFDADNYHVPLDHAASAYSPLTYFQERNLYKQESGASLIFSSEALGLSYLKDALKKFVPSDPAGSSGLFSEMPAQILCSDEMTGWLEKHLESNRKYENLVVYRRIYEEDSGDMADCIKHAIEFCNRQLSRKRWIRVYFIFDPLALWKWLTLTKETRKEIEEKAAASLCTRKWTLEGLKQRLAHHEKLHYENMLKQILKVTGGWPVLLDSLFERCGKQDDVRQFLPAIESELQDSAAALRKGFLASLGIQENKIAYSLLEYLRGFKEDELVPLELLTPEYIRATIQSSDADCRRGLEFLARLGCIDVEGDTVRLDPIVRTIIT